jgi:hypothetical protein
MIAGSGNYRGGELKSKSAAITIAGSGNATLAVSDDLDVKILGDGSIQYIGDPRVTQSVLGSGSIHKR